MPDDDLVYVGHTFDMASKALRLIQGKTRAHYDGDETLRLALAHILQVIGEAARRVSQPFCDANPQVLWKINVGMRHKVVHDYMNVDEDIVWDTVTKELGPLVTELKKILPADDA